MFGPTHNPWDPSLTPSGSSGGAAATVAAGMVPMAHANDLGGSIRYPASACGLFGLKPTRARNPLGPEYGDVVCGMAVEHAVARSVRDSAALLDATSGPALGDPYDAPPLARPFAEEVGAPPGRLRIAFTRRTPEDLPVHADCVAAIDDAMLLCEALGHEVVEADLTALDAAVGAAIGTMFGAATSWILEYWIRKVGRAPEPDEIEPLTRALWENSRNVTAGAFLLAVDDVQRLLPQGCAVPHRLRRVGASDPGRATDAARRDGVDRRRSVGVDAPQSHVRRLRRRRREHHRQPGDVGAALVEPAGVPVGVHFTARFGDEATLLRLASQLETARPWRDRHPAVRAVTDATPRLTTEPTSPRGEGRGVSSFRAARRAAWASPSPSDPPAR